MKPERVSEVLRLHGNEITWESHLAVVELLATWSADEILDFQETLVEHLATGQWTNTRQNAVISLNMGEIRSESVSQQIGVLETILENLGDLPAEMRERFQADLEYLRAWEPPKLVSNEVPVGHIALPLHPWAPLYGFPMGEGDPGKNRKRLVAIINSSDAGATHENRLLLRAGPWAYFRVTGQRLPGVLACDAEEFHETGRFERFTTVVRLRRGSDLVDYLAVMPAPSVAAAAVDRSGYFAKFARSFGAKIERIDARPVDGIQREDDHWLVVDGEVVSDQLTAVERVAGNALSKSLRTALFEPKRKAPARMDAATFWKLIALIDDELSDASVETLVRALAKKPLRSITGFHETLTDQLYSLDRPELTKPPGSTEPSIMSDDVFLHFRCAVVARGSGAVESVLVAGGIVEDDWRGEMGESLIFVAPRAWELKTGEPFEYETELSFESASNDEAWGRDPAPSVIPVGAYSIRSESVADGQSRERVRYWLRPDEAEALAAHDVAERELWGSDYRGVIDSCAIPEYEPLSTTAALARVSYYRPVSSTEST